MNTIICEVIFLMVIEDDAALLRESRKWDLRLITSVLVFIVSVCLVFFAAQQQSGIVIPQFDDTVVYAEVPELGEDMAYSVLSDESLAFKIGLCGRPVIDADGRLDVYLTNPADNDTWLMLKVLSPDGKELGKTGLVKPGGYIESVTGDFEPDSEIRLKVMAYQPDLYYSDGTVVLRTRVAE